jgi:hypothetical protein
MFLHKNVLQYICTSVKKGKKDETAGTRRDRIEVNALLN